MLLVKLFPKKLLRTNFSNLNFLQFSCSDIAFTQSRCLLDHHPKLSFVSETLVRKRVSKSEWDFFFIFLSLHLTSSEFSPGSMKYWWGCWVSTKWYAFNSRFFRFFLFTALIQSNKVSTSQFQLPQFAWCKKLGERR